MTSTLTGTGADATARALLTAREGLAAAQREALEPRPFFDAPGLPSRTGCTIGVDVGGTKVALGMFDNEHVLLRRTQFPADKDLAPEAFLDGIIDACLELVRDSGTETSDLRGIGVAMPSYVNYEEGRIVKTANLPLLKDFPARQYLKDRIGGNVRVLLDNDAHVGALAEHRYGAGRGFRDMLYCPVSTGISSAMIIDNKLFRGRYGWAGESGHMIVNPGQGVECGCGNRGCLMSYCSGAMIVRHIRQWIDEGRDTTMVELVDGTENITCRTLQEAYDLGDEMAHSAIDQMARYLALWIYNVYVLLNINCYVFGGGLLNLGDRLFPKVRAYFDQYNDNDAPVYFRQAELGDDFGIIGAAELMFQ